MNHAKRIGKKIAGVVCLLIALLILVTPFTPGALAFLLAGLELFGARERTVARVRAWWMRQNHHLPTWLGGKKK